MYQFISYLSFLTSGLGVFFIFFLGFRFYRIPKTFWLISVIFAFVYIEFYTYALISKHILQMLFLFRSANIVRALLPIHLFFYVRSMLHPSRPIKPIQYLHYLFPIIVTLGVLPDLLLSAEEKTHILQMFYQKADYLLIRPIGFFPSAFLQPMSMLLVMAYSLYTLSLIFSAQKQYGASYIYVNKHSIGWLKLLCIFVFIYFGMEYMSYRTLHSLHVFDTLSQLIKCLLGIGLFSFFITSPHVQENMDGCIIPEISSDESLIPEVESIYPKLLLEYKSEPEALKFAQNWKGNSCFLDPNCDLASMAKEADMTPSKFSAFLKRYYGISYAEFSNRLKIHYFLTNFNHFDQYTLETYIYQSGFSNRSTFYAAFKKYVGLNPSFYLKELKQS